MSGGWRCPPLLQGCRQAVSCWGLDALQGVNAEASVHQTVAGGAVHDRAELLPGSMLQGGGGGGGGLNSRLELAWQL